ncbi:stage II sporulation protein M [Paractinoplanes ferrugineus]|uniref:Membrane protein n=1 Tax=Paractinoplanes ferrugineus TaxID=113564 RepID=A0A919J0A6_9ACTN|nr:stage II sporulation protein M [Actinoplanes ferrugineus]GIE11369.1 membrane protein [Actinoplanes ferrugineus]
MIDLDAYIAERGGEWQRLRMLARRSKLTAAEADELVLLYQRASTHLSALRGRHTDPVLLADLSQLVLTGRAAVTRRSGHFSWQPVKDFFAYGLPGALYRTRRWWGILALLMVAAGVALVWYLSNEPAALNAFLSEDQMRELVDKEFVGYYSEYRAQNFALEVWTNNAVLTAQCLASGVLILPVIYLLAGNLLNTGVVGGAMVRDGATDTLLTYLAPHGLLELTCLFIGAGVGLRLGWAWIAPGPLRTRRESLVAWVREGMVIAVGLVVALAVAGLLEAFITPSPLPAPFRVGIGAAVWLAFLAYALSWGKVADARRPPTRDDADVPTA